MRGEVTWTAGGIGGCLIDSSAAVKNAALGAGMVVASFCSPGAQGKFQREGLDEGSSCPVIISPGEGEEPPCNGGPPQLLTARKLQVSRGQGLPWGA